MFFMRKGPDMKREHILHGIPMGLYHILFKKGGGEHGEDDIPAEGASETQSSWFSRQNEDGRRKKGTGRQEIEGKKKTDSLV